jgi:tetratricopeptide (TPR) repeat protein
VFGLALFGCVKEIPIETPAQTQQAIPADKSPVPAQPLQPTPRVQASLNLTEQGRLLIEKGQADNAIRVLEQAISLNPGNGQNYYYLSEAWLLKESFKEAQEFNRLAELHLKKDEDWMRKVARQAERIAAQKN